MARFVVTIVGKKDGATRKESVFAFSAEQAERAMVGTAAQKLGRYHFDHWAVVSVDEEPEDPHDDARRAAEIDPYFD